MSRIIADRVMETSTVTGTGSATVAGAVPGFQAFSTVMTAGDTFDYVIFGVDGSGVPTGEWESGRGTYPSANTIARTTVIDGSSGAGTPVSFSAGTKNIMATNVAQTLKDILGSVPLNAPWTLPKVADFSGGSSLGTTTWTDHAYGIGITGLGQAFGLRAKWKTPPSAPYSIYCRATMPVSFPSNNNRIGIVLANSVSGKFLLYGFRGDAAHNQTGGLMRWNSAGSYAGDNMPLSMPLPAWTRVDLTSTTAKFFVGDGYEWIDTGVNETLAGFINSSGAIDGIGYGTQDDAGAPASPLIVNLNSFSTTAPAAGGGGI